MSKKKITDPDGAMEELIKKAVDLAQAPFTPERNTSLPSLRSVATELGTTVIRARKLLITADYFTSPTASAVQKMIAEGKNKLTIDMADTVYISSVGLRTLLATQKECKAAGGDMVIKNAGEMVRKVFEVTGFAQIFSIEG